MVLSARSPDDAPVDSVSEQFSTTSHGAWVYATMFHKAGKFMLDRNAGKSPRNNVQV
jgi:hypothetical protein